MNIPKQFRALTQAVLGFLKFEKRKINLETSIPKVVEVTNDPDVTQFSIDLDVLMEVARRRHSHGLAPLKIEDLQRAHSQLNKK